MKWQQFVSYHQEEPILNVTKTKIEWKTFHVFLLFNSNSNTILCKSNVILTIVFAIPSHSKNNFKSKSWYLKMNIQLQSQCMHTFPFYVCCCFNFCSKYLQTIKCYDYGSTLSFMLTNSFFSTKLAPVIFFEKIKICINFNGKDIDNWFQFVLKIFTYAFIWI